MRLRGPEDPKRARLKGPQPFAQYAASYPHVETKDERGARAEQEIASTFGEVGRSLPKFGPMLAGMLPGVGEAMDAYDVGSGLAQRDWGRVGLGAAGLALPFVAAGSLKRLGGAASDALRPVKFGEQVGGLRVGERIKNMDSIGSTLDEWEDVGLREVPMDKFPAASAKDSFYAADDMRRVRDLSGEIKQSGRIDPLIVVEDADGFYVLEGGHRLSALHELGAKSFPAHVVRDSRYFGGER